MTPQDAAKRWCPFAFPKDVRAGFNRSAGDVSIDNHCIATNCMAWVVDDDATGDGHCGLINRPPSPRQTLTLKDKI